MEGDRAAAAVGAGRIVAGLLVGSLISDRTFKLLIACIVLFCLVLLVRTELRKGEAETRRPGSAGSRP